MKDLHDILNTPPKDLPRSPKDTACYPAAIAFGLTTMGRRTAVVEIDKVMNRPSEQYTSFLEQIRCMGWLAQQGYHIRHIFSKRVTPYREWLGPKATMSPSSFRREAVRSGTPRQIAERDLSDQRIDSARLFFAKGGPLATSRYTEETSRLKESFIVNWLQSARGAFGVVGIEVGRSNMVHATTLTGYHHSVCGEHLTALFSPAPSHPKLAVQDISLLMRTGQIAEDMNQLFVRR